MGCIEKFALDGVFFLFFPFGGEMGGSLGLLRFFLFLLRFVVCLVFWLLCGYGVAVYFMRFEVGCVEFPWFSFLHFNHKLYGIVASVCPNTMHAASKGATGSM